MCVCVCWHFMITFPHILNAILSIFIPSYYAIVCSAAYDNFAVAPVPICYYMRCVRDHNYIILSCPAERTHVDTHYIIADHHYSNVNGNTYKPQLSKHNKMYFLMDFPKLVVMSHGIIAHSLRCKVC